jgi:hypothetical protein
MLYICICAYVHMHVCLCVRVCLDVTHPPNRGEQLHDEQQQGQKRTGGAAYVMSCPVTNYPQRGPNCNNSIALHLYCIASSCIIINRIIVVVVINITIGISIVIGIVPVGFHHHSCCWPET